ncbi:Ribonuclease HI [Arachis hypogaea]|nr:Ribonuclease HI [Arachis hypogaea]
MNNGKYRLYAVRRGRIPRIYTSWEDYKEQVNGFKDAEFKGFCLLRDAQHWLGVVNPPLTLPPPPELDSGVHPLTGLFEQPFSLSKHFNSMHVGPTLGESSQKAFVPCSQIPQGTGASVGMVTPMVSLFFFFFPFKLPLIMTMNNFGCLSLSSMSRTEYCSRDFFDSVCIGLRYGGLSHSCLLPGEA